MESRILTTHVGSLSRDPELRPLFAALSKGQDVDAMEMEQTIVAATSATLDRQISAGLDVVNDGEQGRESFFTYIQHRMTGFGGESERPFMADRIPFKEFAERSVAKALAEDRVSLIAAPRAIGDVAYTDEGRAALKIELNRLSRALDGRTDYAGASQFVGDLLLGPEPVGTLDFFTKSPARALDLAGSGSHPPAEHQRWQPYDRDLRIGETNGLFV